MSFILAVAALFGGCETTSVTRPKISAKREVLSTLLVGFALILLIWFSLLSGMDCTFTPKDIRSSTLLTTISRCRYAADIIHNPSTVIGSLSVRLLSQTRSLSITISSRYPLFFECSPLWTTYRQTTFQLHFRNWLLSESPEIVTSLSERRLWSKYFTYPGSNLYVMKPTAGLLPLLCQSCGIAWEWWMQYFTKWLTLYKRKTSQTWPLLGKI